MLCGSVQVDQGAISQLANVDEGDEVAGLNGKTGGVQAHCILVFARDVLKVLSI